VSAQTATHGLSIGRSLVQGSLHYSPAIASVLAGKRRASSPVKARITQVRALLRFEYAVMIKPLCLYLLAHTKVEASG
jgi:hypothetical protein